MTDFLKIAAPGIAGLNPYVPGKPMSELERELGIYNAIKLASNENPLGASKKAKAAAAQVVNEMQFYPDGGGYSLKLSLSEKLKVSTDGITLGNGSNDVLDLVARTFLSPGLEAIFSQHAFAVYPICTQAVGAKSQVAPADQNYGHDLDAMSALINDQTRVIFIANPNNPTGTWLSQQKLADFLQQVPAHVIVVLDEAYFEYVGETNYPDGSQWLAQYENLVVTRTFSKAYGLAGLRIGYALSSPAIAELLNRVRQPFNVNAVALAAAEAALADSGHLEQSVSVNIKGLAQLENGLQSLGLTFIPSVGNFISVLLPVSAMVVDQALLRKGCICRPVENYGLPNGLRVTVGLAEQNERFLTALAEVLNK